MKHFDPNQIITAKCFHCFLLVLFAKIIPKAWINFLEGARVVYFNQLMVAAYNQKLIKILLSVFLLLHFIPLLRQEKNWLWWPSGLSGHSNSSRVAAEDPGLNAA